MPAVYLAVLLSASAFVMTVFSFFFFRSYLKRRTGQERILSELREEIDSIVLSLDEKTERDISLIEEREKNLKLLLDDIDKRLRVYTRELENRRKDEAVHAALAAKPRAPTYQELGKSRRRLSAQTGETTEIAAAELPAVEPPPPPPAVSAPPPPEPGAMGEQEQIRELARAGFAPPIIASRLGISIAEVEFVMALMERREQ